MSELSSKHCLTCRVEATPLESSQKEALLSQLSGWEVIEDHHLSKQFNFPDFVSALAFVNRVSSIAEVEGHHPDLHLSWGRGIVEIWTHKINGLTESDFILAAKIEMA